MRLGVGVRGTRGVGAIVNLQSNDASKIWMIPTYIHLLWNAPFQVRLDGYKKLHVCDWKGWQLKPASLI